MTPCCGKEDKNQKQNRDTGPPKNNPTMAGLKNARRAVFTDTKAPTKGGSAKMNPPDGEMGKSERERGAKSTREASFQVRRKKGKRVEKKMR